MERHIPSTGSSGSLYSTNNNTGFRRRSGKHNSLDSKTGRRRSPILSSSSYSAHGIDWLCEVDEDDDDSVRERPTVILVQNLPSSHSHGSLTSGLPPLVPVLPTSSFYHVHANDEEIKPAPGGNGSFYPDVPVANQSEDQNRASPTSVTGTTDPSFLSIFTRRPTFRAFARPDHPPRVTFTMITPEHSPSNDSAVSSFPKKPSLCRGESSYLIPSVNTTEKFTNKWPRPQSFRTLTGSENGGIFNERPVESIDESKLEEGRVASFSTYDPWNKHKTFLLVSSVTVLMYGTACLTTALMTWFRGQ